MKLPALAFLLLAGLATAALQEAGKEYFPLAVGTEWTMDLVATGPEGQVQKGSAHRRVEEEVPQGNQRYVRTRTWTKGPVQFEYTKLVRKDATGLHSIDERVSRTEQTEIPLPWKVGATWATTSGPLTLTNTVIGKETVNIGGKVYEDCYHIRIQAKEGGYTEDFWEAPGMGSIKAEIVTNGGKIVLTLREFKAGTAR